jgi:PAS domain S-box-containing protein
MSNKGAPKARTRRGRSVRYLRRQLARPKPGRNAPDGVAETPRTAVTKALAHYRNLFDNAPIPYVMLDALGIVVEGNLTYSDLMELPRRALIGKPLGRALAEADRKPFMAHMRRCRRDNAARTEVRLETGSGTVPVELDSRLAPMRVGEAARFATAIIDLRERHEIENARVAAELERQRAEQREREAKAANDAKDRFLAELSHELRTPLTPILAATTTLTDDALLPVGLRPTIEMIRRNIQAEARLIDDLLDVSRLGHHRPRLELQGVDTHEVIRQIALELEPEFRVKGVGLSLRLSASERRILADPVRLRQILSNLLSNALCNTSAAGSVLVATSNIARDLRIVVRDDGIGIAADELENIFEPFFRQDAEPGAGLGLGLTIVKGLVEAHGGRVHALSEGKNRGATFAIELPILESSGAEAPAPAANERQVVAPSEHRSVLLVEDHADTREALQIYLEMKGYEVRLAGDARSALEAARQPVDVIVCDIGLPDESGFDLMRKISAARPVKAIALTGYGGPREQRLASAAGFAAHLTKPVGAEKLVAAIEQLFAT